MTHKRPTEGPFRQVPLGKPQGRGYIPQDFLHTHHGSTSILILTSTLIAHPLTKKCYHIFLHIYL